MRWRLSWTVMDSRSELQRCKLRCAHRALMLWGKLKWVLHQAAATGGQARGEPTFPVSWHFGLSELFSSLYRPLFFFFTFSSTPSSFHFGPPLRLRQQESEPSNSTPDRRLLAKRSWIRVPKSPRAHASSCSSCSCDQGLKIKCCASRPASMTLPNCQLGPFRVLIHR